MVNVSIARRYARALLESSGADADKVLASLQEFVLALQGSTELTDVVNNPAYSRAQRLAVVEGLINGSALQPVLANTIRLLNDRNRLGQLGDVARVYAGLVDAKLGRVRGRITSATPLSESQLKGIAASLEKITQRQVLLDAKVDRAVLGGITAQVGSFVYDGSLRNELETLARDLK
jgi:F-type H+-transporting ATPase subunit delta